MVFHLCGNWLQSCLQLTCPFSQLTERTWLLNLRISDRKKLFGRTPKLLVLTTGKGSTFKTPNSMNAYQTSPILETSFFKAPKTIMPTPASPVWSLSMCLWRPEVNIWYLLQTASPCIFKDKVSHGTWSSMIQLH